MGYLASLLQKQAAQQAPTLNASTWAQTLRFIMGNEGFSPKVNKDRTIGFGFTMEPRFAKWFTDRGYDFNALASGRAQIKHSDAIALVRQKLQENMKTLSVRVPNFYKLPANAQTALLDWSYHAGPDAKYPNMLNAADRQDWPRMAKEMTVKLRDPKLDKGVQARNQRRVDMINTLVPKTEVAAAAPSAPAPVAAQPAVPQVQSQQVASTATQKTVVTQ